MKRIHIICFFSAFLFASCSKDNSPAYNPTVKSGLSIEFDNIAGSSDLQLNTGSYTNAAGESFSVTSLRYYVSNFILTSKEGTVFTVPQDSCYFLIDESDEDTHEPVLQVPVGEYKTISFILGVDSARSLLALDKRIGVLDPFTIAKEMYMGMDSGYIFFNMEGNAAVSPQAGQYKYHIGGYGAKIIPTINNIKTITLDLSSRGMPIVREGFEPNIHLMVDILKVFNGPTNISISSKPVVGYDEFSKLVAANYTAMFRHDHTENE